MAGIFNGFPNPSSANGGLPLTGVETFPLDLNTAADNGVAPTTVNITTAQAFGVGTPVALTDGTSIATDASLGLAFSVTLAGNRTLANPTNLTNGRTYRWEIAQDSTGSRTLAYGTLFTFSGSSTLTTTASAIDIITAWYDGTKLRCVLSKAYA